MTPRQAPRAALDLPPPASHARAVDLSLRDWLTYAWTYRRPEAALWSVARPVQDALGPVLAARPPGRALDVGCGTGRDVLRLARAGWSVLGLDLFESPLRCARAEASRAGLTARAEFRRHPASRLHTLDGRFDLVLDVLGAASDLDGEAWQRYVAAIPDRLEPGGLFLCFGFGGTDLGAALAPRLTPAPRWAPAPASPAARWTALTRASEG